MSSLTCKLAGCNAFVFIEANGRAHDFCGKTHARQYAAIKTCQLPGCTKACAVDSNTKVSYDYCGKTHRDEHKLSLQKNGMCTKCRKNSVVKNGKWCDICWATASGQLSHQEPIIKRVPVGSALHESLTNQFLDKWLHSANKPQVVEIMEVFPPKNVIERYAKYKEDLEKKGNFASVVRKNKHLSPGNECRRFHGTSMECELLGVNGNTTPCSSSSCKTCSIIHKSFSLAVAGSNSGWVRFGKGIYFSSTSSKSHDYNQGSQKSWNGKMLRVMFISKVLVGKGYKLTQNSTNLTEPPAGYDSVLGEVGVHLNYDEVVVYKEEACKPTYLIVYQV